MGETRKEALKLGIDRRLKVEFHRTKVAGDVGLSAHRDLDEALGFNLDCRFEAEILVQSENLTFVMNLPGV